MCHSDPSVMSGGFRAQTTPVREKDPTIRSSFHTPSLCCPSPVTPVPDWESVADYLTAQPVHGLWGLICALTDLAAPPPTHHDASPPSIRETE